MDSIFGKMLKYIPENEKREIAVDSSDPKKFELHLYHYRKYCFLFSEGQSLTLSNALGKTYLYQRLL